MTDLPELSDDEDLTFTFRVSTGESAGLATDTISIFILFHLSSAFCPEGLSSL